MKQHLLTLFLALAASVGTLFAQSGTCGTNLTWTLDTESGTLTISGTGAMKDYTYNSSYYRPNTPWYSYRESIKTVKIGSSVTSIGDYAFCDCSSLTSVTIPNSVTSIGYEAFWGCSGLTSITIPNSVTSIGDMAFRECSSLTSVTIPNSVTSIGYWAFQDCSSLTSITIPNSVASIGWGTFYGCSSLTSITIPNSVTSIGGEAFSGCTGLPVINNIRYADTYLLGAVNKTLSTYTIKEGTKFIGDGAFSGCGSLTSITIPNSVTYIGDYAFNDCSSLTSATIGNSVTSIGEYAFYNCSSLTSITIPNSVTSIGEGAFSYCNSLTSVTIGTSVTYIGASAFEDCSSLTSLTCEAVAPPTLENRVFDGVDKSIPLYVPAQSIDLYKTADQWKDFTNILPLTAASGGATGGIGLFSVSATQQVTFSPGNLQYQASTNTWRFAEHQWDMVGMGYGQTDTDNSCYIGGTVANSDNRQIGSNYSGWIDLFGWGTGNEPTKSSDYYRDYQTFVDWGTNPISNGGNQANKWRTLTYYEWDYLFSGRANASSKYGVGMVNGINGMIVLPDEFTLPSGLTFTSGVHNSYYGWEYYKEVNEYSAAEWALMEACGALFLPAAGYRSGSYVDGVGDYGYYWSSIPGGTYGAHYRRFYSDDTDGNYHFRQCGFSVRLVRAAQSEQEPVYSLSVSVEGEGTVTGAGEYKKGTTATLTATPASGYTFSQWSDGNTDNPRTITMERDLTLTAVFAKNTFLVSFLNYDGTELQSSEVEAGTMPQYNGTEPTKPADALHTYTFAGWSPDVVAATGDATYTARFEAALLDNITLQENETADYYTQFANDYNGQRVNTATLNRQFTQGKWATLCLPFNVNKAMMMALGLYNRVFAFRYAQQLDDETIQVFFVPAQSIEAGKGYIVNPNAKLAAKTSFVFPSVTINTDSDNGDITALTGYNDGTGRGNLFLVGTLRTGILQGSTTGNTYLGLKDNQLYYPNSTSGTLMRAYRAVFRSGTPVNASRLRIIADGETVSELQVVGTAPSDGSDKSDPSYTPARKYLHNGLLFIERNGITYTAQGHRLD